MKFPAELLALTAAVYKLAFLPVPSPTENLEHTANILAIDMFSIHHQLKILKCPKMFILSICFIDCLKELSLLCFYIQVCAP